MLDFLMKYFVARKILKSNTSIRKIFLQENMIILYFLQKISMGYKNVKNFFFQE